MMPDGSGSFDGGPLSEGNDIGGLDELDDVESNVGGGGK